MASCLQMAGLQTDSTKPVIDLDEINGNVHLTHKLEFRAFQIGKLSPDY